MGFRLSATTLVKTTYRGDRWHVTPENAAFIRPWGHALALQVSQAYDVLDWVERVRVK